MTHKPLIMDVTVRDPLGGKVYQQKGKDMHSAMNDLDKFMKSKYTNPAESVPTIIVPKGI